MTRGLASLVCASLIALSSVVVEAESANADAKLDARVQVFSQQVRCLVCQNETLAESEADLAVDLRREIREQMNAGRTDEQITAFLTARYGDFVLYRPPLKPSTYLLWFGPLAFLGGGFWTLYRGLTRWPSAPALKQLTAGERKRARQLLESQEREETA